MNFSTLFHRPIGPLEVTVFKYLVVGLFETIKLDTSALNAKRPPPTF